MSYSPTTKDWLDRSTAKLKQAGVGTARLDALVLMEDATGKDRSWLLAHPEYPVKGLALHKLEEQISKRTRHIPLSYIRGKTEFYGREYIINKHVLEPRPESETMIELLLDLVESRKLKVESLRILDIGTGSGALAITAKLEIPKAEVIATDIDENCLETARQNAKKHKTNIKFIKSDLFSNLSPVTCNLIMANLPYVPNKFKLNEAAANEPKLAIFGGSDGLDVYRRFFDQLKGFKKKPTLVLTESLPFQHQKLAQIAKESGYKLANTADFIQLFSNY